MSDPVNESVNDPVNDAVEPVLARASAIALALVTLALAGCGGPPPRVDDEVSAEWTAGDDAPLEESGEPEP